ncbi:MAG: DNA recombination protein RmuC, partial [Desulfuromonas sp.]
MTMEIFLAGIFGVFLGAVTVYLSLKNRLLSLKDNISREVDKSEGLIQQLRENQQVTTTLNDEKHRLEIILHQSKVRFDADKEKMAELQQRLENESGRVVALNQQIDDYRNRLSDVEKGSERYQTRVDESLKKVNELREQIVSLTNKNDELQLRFTELTKIHTEMETSLAERDRSHQQQLAQFEEQKQALSEQFKVLANDILEAKSQSLQEHSKITLDAVISPFKQSIEEFKKEVNDIHSRETMQQGVLRRELEHLKELNMQITREAHELSTALRGQKKLQGNWGELVLENVLDRSGLQQGKDYDREVSFTTEDGRKRPDVVVYLPQGKHLIIDAKVSLEAYTRYVNSEDEAERATQLQAHVRAVSDRIQELANRDYSRLPGVKSPEVVFMFVPIESAFVEALKADETLFQRAIEKNVLVATPTTLLTSLNIV